MKKIVLLFAFLCYIAYGAVAQEKEFWFVAPDVSEQHGNCDGPTRLVISNPSEDTPSTIEVYSNGGATLERTATIAPKGYEEIYWPLADTRARIENLRSSAGTVTQKGIYVKVTSGDGVLAYYQVAGSCSDDLFSLKGPYALGDEFYVPMMHDNHYPAQPSYTDDYDQIDIVAAKACRIKVTPTNNCVGGYTAGVESGWITLNPGETFKLMENTTVPFSTTLAGTKIVSDIPNSIAVTITEDAAQSSTSHDVIGDQIVPVNCVGTRYVVVKGYTSGAATDRIYLTAAKGPASVTITGDGGFSATKTLTAAGNTDVIDIGPSGATPNVVYIESDAPIYCYHVSGFGNELGSALIPSMFSITQQRLAFFALNTVARDMFLVYRDTCETYFEITDGFTTQNLGLTAADANPIPGLGGAITWKWSKVQIPATMLNKVVTVSNTESNFSLGYFDGNTTGTSGYGYISGFGDW